MGPNILESVLMSYLLIIYEQIYLPTQQLSSRNIQEDVNRSETFKTLNMLLNTFESYFIWEFLAKNFDIIINEQQDQMIITAGATIEQICGIIDMLLDVALLQSSADVQSEHLPEMLYHLIKTMNNNISKYTVKQITLCIEILLKILKKVVPTKKTHRLSTFHCSISDDTLYLSEQNHNVEDLTDDDDDDDISNELDFSDHSLNTIDQQCLNEIEHLLYYMVHKIGKQMNKFNKKNLSNEQQITSSSNMLKSMNHLEKSISLYKIFFHRFITTFIIDTNKISIYDKFQSITQKTTNENGLILLNNYQIQDEFQLKLNDNVDCYQRAYDNCCKLLIESCCFQRQSSITDQTTLLKGT